MIIAADNIIVGDGSTVLKNSAIYIGQSGRIEEIGEKDKLTGTYPDEAVMEYPRGTLLPGLIDLHAHQGHWGFGPSLPMQNDYMMAYVTLYHARRAFSRGVTTLRDVGSPEGVCMTMKEAAKLGFFKIPRMEYCGSGLCITGGHGSSYGMGEGVEEVDGVDAVKKAVRTRIKHQSKWIKIMTSHRSDVCEFSQEELNAAADECHRLGVKLTAHSGTQPSIGMCIEAGFDSIEHGTFITDEQIQAMVEKRIAWIPTILPYTSIYENMKIKYPDEKDAPAEYFYCKAAADQYKDNFKRYYDTGVLIGAGTDNITNKGVTDLHVARELQYMVKYGITPLQAIQVGTANGAKILDMDHMTGQIKKGLEADLLVVRGNPAENIEDLEQVEAVYLGGEMVYQGKIGY